MIVYDDLKKMVDSKLSIRLISIKEKCAEATVIYWLRKYGLKTDSINTRNKGKCKEYKGKCGEIDPLKFYGHKKQICAKCHNEYNNRVGSEKRRKAISSLGGECKICGYNKYYGSIDLHHIDPSKKDSQFKNLYGWSWERIEKEIKNCVLLCKNCHGEVHAGIVKL